MIAMTRNSAGRNHAKYHPLFLETVVAGIQATWASAAPAMWVALDLDDPHGLLEAGFHRRASYEPNYGVSHHGPLTGIAGDRAFFEHLKGCVFVDPTDERRSNVDSLVETQFSAKSPPLVIAPGAISEAILGSYERVKFRDYLSCRLKP